MDNKSENGSTVRRLHLNISKAVMMRLDEIMDIENLSKSKMLEKIIMTYSPTPVVSENGIFKPVDMRHIRTVQKMKPYAIVVSVWWNGKLGIDYKTYIEYKENKITWEQFTRKYIERLMLPDAQEEIKRLMKLKESNDIYIVSWEADEDHSIRRLFVDFVEGKLVWK